ncbi:BlaR1 family beta-lactam sensor/signal transducer [Evansella halocellulosilytica]|uniref:BlaR1 family beta-lactam sensor/signal transducer n=1 Tax=Evansella halocellulosilytica TaxID=2011013 RepID=UPI000BB737B6|nr:BlaR1 family beta-lactam sensor/signal transducer [Evansella halocellulosilytica]
MTLPHMLTSFVLSTVTIIVILLVRKIFHNQLSAKWRYHLWFLLIFVLTLPFIPVNLITVPNFFHFDQHESQIFSSAQNSLNLAVQNEHWMSDFGTEVNRFDDTFIHLTVLSIWAIGMILFFLVTLYHHVKLRRIVMTATKIKSVKVRQLFADCTNTLGITKKPMLLETSSIQSPLTFGLFKTYILLPKNMTSYLSENEIKYVLLHELHHYKSKHIKVNYVFVIYQIVYWFNPLVWKAFKEMRLDREMACDTEVLRSLDRSDYKKYGNTIIRFAERNAQSSYLHLTNPLYGPKRHVKRRIINIVSFTEESKLLQLKSLIIFTLLSLFVIAQFPVLTGAAVSSERYVFDNNQTVYEDWSTHFGEYEGSFVLYSTNQDQFQIYNKEKSVTRVSPNSTFKIYTALMALESGVITRDDSLLEWDGVHHNYDAWNTNHNLATAMNQSVTWYFQELDRHMQKDNIQHYINELDYGNKDLSGGLREYWLESSLKISPVEQVELLREFYANQFNFRDNNVHHVKEVLKLEENRGATLYGKTGTGMVNGKVINGWFIGFLETDTDTYFFATNIQHDDNAYGSDAAEITLSILNSEGIY